MNPQYMSRIWMRQMILQIINVLRREGVLDEEDISSFPEKFPEFTLEEFRRFTKAIFDNEGGGWDNVHKFQEEGAYFETYNIPFVFDGEAFYLSVMYKRVQRRCTLMTKQHFEEYLDRIAASVAKHSELFRKDNGYCL